MHKRKYTCFTTYGGSKKPEYQSTASCRADTAWPGQENLENLSQEKFCTSKAYQKATVSVPVAVKPFSIAGKPRTFCNGDPVLRDTRCGSKYDPYDEWTDYRQDGGKCDDEICFFTFTQEICIEVPVHFGAKVHLDQPRVECHEASTEPCDDCELDTDVADTEDEEN